MSKKHRTPWTFDENEDYQIMIYDAGEEPVAQVIGEDYEADAKFIIEACNHYEGVKRDLAKQISQRDKLYKELGTLNDVAVNLQRSRAALIEDNNRLHDLVRRMISPIKDQRSNRWLYCFANNIDMEGDRYLKELDDLVNEAGEAIGEKSLNAPSVPEDSAEAGILRSALERIVDLLRRESPMHEDGVDPVDILDIAREALKQAEGVSK